MLRYFTNMNRLFVNTAIPEDGDLEKSVTHPLLVANFLFEVEDSFLSSILFQ